MRRADRPAFVIHYQDYVTSPRLAAIDDVAGKDPRMAGCHSIGSFSINADGVQTPV
jgi:hypothetical protein